MSGEINPTVQILPQGQMEVGGRVVDFSRSEVRFRDGGSNGLSEREAQLLRYLAGNPGRVISRDEILARVWRLNSSRILTRVIDMHVAHLREKLRDKKAGLLRTVYGRGYLFVARTERPVRAPGLQDTVFSVVGRVPPPGAGGILKEKRHNTSA